MFDLNPLEECGIDRRDIAFSQLLILWTAATYDRNPCADDQIRCISNFKRAAHYDLRTVRILRHDGKHRDAVDAGTAIIRKMKDFFGEDAPEEVKETLDFEQAKFDDAQKRYAWIIRKRYRDDFVKKTQYNKPHYCQPLSSSCTC